MKQPGVSEILEWTFKYDQESRIDGIPYNTTFFESIGRVSYAQWKNAEITNTELVTRVEEKFTSWLQALEGIRDMMRPGRFPDKKMALEHEGINFIILGIQAAQPVISIELEKASKAPFLDTSERQRVCKEVELGQLKLYGGRVSDSREESISSLGLLSQEFFESSERLTAEQSVRFLAIFDQLKQRVAERWEGSDIPDIGDFRKHTNFVHAFTERTFEKLRATKVSKCIYMRLWQQYIDLMGLHQKVVSSTNVTSIYDGPDELEVPDSASYDEIGLDRVLTLMIHEIGVHYVNQAISEKNGFQIRGANNIEKEEGLAIILEGLFEGRKLADLKAPGYAYPYILAGELLSKKERQDLIDLRIVMEGNKNGDEGYMRDLRVMRGFPLDGPGAQRKDMSYGRGKNRMVDLVTSGKCSVSDFYRGKFSIDDIASGRLNELIPRENIVLPLLFPEMILFRIGIGEKEFTYEDFMNYMREKYAGDISDEDLNNMETAKEFRKLRIFVTMWRDIEKNLPHDIV